MFSWKDKDKIKEAVEANKDIVITESPVYNNGIQGVGLSIGDDPTVYATIEDIKKAHPEVNCLYVWRGDSCGKCIISSNSSGIPILYTALSISVPTRVLISVVLENSKAACTILENKREAEAYVLKIKIEELEKLKSDIKEFLDDPWRIYEDRKKEFAQKLEKAKASTEFKIKHSRESLMDLEKELEKKKKELLNLLKSGFSDDGD